MTEREILSRRLRAQHIPASAFTKPHEIVSHLLAMQAQEFAMAKWAIGLRVNGVNNAAVERAFNDGKILRTHLMRPTWHFVVPKDIRWLIELTAPRIRKIMAPYDTQLGLTSTVFRKAIDTLAASLEGGKQLMRTEIRAELAKKKLPLEESRLSHILMHAELACIVVSGKRVGKQFTYALFDERAPNARSLDRDEAVAALTKRYFATRGPATIQDFMWWSGLAAADARAGVAALPKQFVRERIGRKEYLFSDSLSFDPKQQIATFLLPDYDEYGISYKDREAINPLAHKGPMRNGVMVFNHIVIVDGIAAGTWERNASAKVHVTLSHALNKRQQDALQKAVKAYEAFFA